MKITSSNFHIYSFRLHTRLHFYYPGLHSTFSMALFLILAKPSNIAYKVYRSAPLLGPGLHPRLHAYLPGLHFWFPIIFFVVLAK
jgi:hypothetical protein